MLFRLAVRGIPNFSYLQYEEFEDMLEVFAKYFVKVRSSIGTGYETAEIFNKEGKRVILYILPEEHSAEALRDMCGNYSLCMSPSKLDSSRLGTGGTGRAGIGQWQALDPSRFPGYEDAKKAHREACKRAALAQRAAEEREEAEAKEMDRALSSAIDAKGREEVLKTLQAMGA